MNDLSDQVLPQSWAIARIAEVSEINPGLRKSEIDDNLEVSFVPMPAVEAECGRVDVSATRKFGGVKKGYTAFSEGDVLFAKITPCMENGKMAVVPALKNEIGFGSTEFHVLRPRLGISPNYLYYFVSAQPFRRNAEHNMTGAVGQRRVPMPYMAQQLIPVPPKHEQRRIAAKIEVLFSELDKGVESLTAAREQLKAYRQSVLKAAFEGRLTETWRAQNGKKIEESSQLSADIELERARLYANELSEWEKAVSAANKAGLLRPRKPSKPSKADRPSPQQMSLMGDLPTSWTWSQVGDFAFVTKLAGFEYTEFVKYDETGDLQVIKAENAGPNGFRETSFSKIRSETVAELERSKLVGGELLMVFVGAGTGNVATVPSGRSFFLGPNIAMMRVTSKHVNPKYVESFLRSPLGRELMLSSVKAVAQPSLSMGTIRQIPIPLSSFDEQTEIVAILDSKLEAAELMNAEIEAGLARAEALRQSILKRAFCGKLVAQDAADEPASVLLERIRAEQGEGTSRKRRTNKTAKKEAA